MLRVVNCTKREEAAFDTSKRKRWMSVPSHWQTTDTMELYHINPYLTGDYFISSVMHRFLTIDTIDTK